MKYECYFCGRKVETTDLFATISTHIETEGNIIEDLKYEKLCGWCASHLDYWRKIIKEHEDKEKKQ